jgi:hypothetical protein
MGDKAIQRARSAPNKKGGGQHNRHLFFSAPAGAQLDCFAIGGAKRRRSSNGYGSQ